MGCIIYCGGKDFVIISIWVSLDFAESTPLYSVTDDEENIEEEFRKLELDIGHENHHEPIVKTEVNNAVETQSSAEVLLDSLSNLKLSDDGQARIPAIQGTASTVRNNKTKTSDLATA